MADSVLLLPQSASSTKQHVPHSQARRQLTTEHESYICTLRMVLAHKHCEHRARAVQQAHRMLLHRMLPHKPSSSHLNEMGGIAGSGVVLKHGTAFAGQKKRWRYHAGTVPSRLLQAEISKSYDTNKPLLHAVDARGVPSRCLGTARSVQACAPFQYAYIRAFLPHALHPNSYLVKQQG